jgi:two-component system, sensor histidine kinase and response regulator
MRKILVIDDTDFIREDIATTLQFEGYITVTAEDGLVGVEKAKLEKPDLILCDVSMPRLDGFGTLEHIRAAEGISTTPFIFLTAKAEKSDMRRGMELGADDYLTKPFTTDELIKAVETQFSKQKQVTAKFQQEMDSVIGNITYALPHEFRTPLNGLLGCADLLIDIARAGKSGEPVDMDEVELMATSIQDSAKRLHRLTENFLVYTQIQSLAANPREVAELQKQRALGLRSTIEDIVMTQATVFSRQDDVTLDVDEAEIVISNQNFYKIVDEVVSNAFKFSTAGQKITVLAKDHTDHYTLAITDCGRGMKEEYIKRIGAYSQFEREIHEQQGAGLGLAIVKKLVEMHNGTFELESVVDDHTTVRLTFVAVPQDESAAS